MIENAREYLNKKFDLANYCLVKNVEYNKNKKIPRPDSASTEEYNKWWEERGKILNEIWSPLSEFQKKHMKEPSYYIKKGGFYARVYFTPGIEQAHYIITDEKIPARFIKNQLKRDPWSIVITRDFIKRYTILHLIWFLSILGTNKTSEFKPTDNPLDRFEFPDYIPKCRHCGCHFTKLHPNQQYCNPCMDTVKKMGFNPYLDKNGHRYCQNCGEHLPNNKHKKAKFCNGTCRIAYFRKNQKEKNI